MVAAAGQLRVQLGPSSASACRGALPRSVSRCGSPDRALVGEAEQWARWPAVEPGAQSAVTVVTRGASAEGAAEQWRAGRL